MRINHNIAALNTYRQLSHNQGVVSKSLERLSSGLRINRAADDAAGLAVSEKMRSQIRGLQMAERNAMDGVSLIQTAEGALGTIHSILQRMRELAVQTANGTNTLDDRKAVQEEIDQLAEEISRIGKTTDFNTQKLLDGTFQSSVHIGANQNQQLAINISDMRGFSLGVVGDGKFTEEVAYTQVGANQDIKDGIYTVDGTDLKDANGVVVATTPDGKSWTSTAGDTFTFTQVVDSGFITIAGGKATGTAEFGNTGLEAGTFTLDFANMELKDDVGNVVAQLDVDNKTIKSPDGTKTLMVLDEPATADMTIKIGGLDMTTRTSANNAIPLLDEAISKVSAERSKLGAYQNRLEHTISNLSVSSENLTASESRIRDADMALEMTNFTKNNIIKDRKSVV